MYERMHRKASGKVDHLIGFYKAAGVNIFVDEMPSFVSECDRVLRNSFHKTTVESLSDASAAAHASLPYEYDYKKTIAQMQKSSASEYRERCIETWSELFRPSEDIKPSNTFITEGKLDVKPDLEESGSAFPETDGRKSKSAAA
eukprot:gene23832-25407_t